MTFENEGTVNVDEGMEALDEGSPESPQPPSVESGWYMCCAIVTVVLSVMALGGAGYGCYAFFDNLNFADFSPDPNDLLGMAHMYESYYGESTLWHHPLYIELQSKPRGQPLNEDLRALEMIAFSAMGMDMLEQMGMMPYPVGEVASYYLPGYKNTSLLTGINNDTLLVMLNWLDYGAKPFDEAMNNYMQSSYLVTSGRYTVKISGMPILLQAMQDDVLANMALIDAICVPVSLILFVIALRTSPFTILIPLITLPMSMAFGFALSTPLHYAYEITAFAPEMMASVVVALSIDFALFLVSRVQEFIEDVGDFSEAKKKKGRIVKEAFQQVSKNIAISGIAITAAFGGLGFINNDFVRSIAFVSSIGAASTTFVSLTFLPALVFLLFPVIFMPMPHWLQTAWERAMAHVKRIVTKKGGNENEREEPTSQDQRIHLLSANENQDAKSHGFWHRVAQISASHPFLILLPVAILVGLCVWSFWVYFDTNDNSFATSPFTNYAFPNYIDVMNDFGATSMSPYYLVFYNTMGGAWATRENFVWIEKIVQKVVAEPRLGLTLRDVTSPNVWNGSFISFDEALHLQGLAKNPNATQAERLEGEYYKSMISQCFSENSYEPSYGMIALRPRGEFAWSWGKTHCEYMRNLRDFTTTHLIPMVGFNKEISSDWFIGYYGPNAGPFDVSERVKPQFHSQVLITFAVLTFLIALLFRSFFLGIRMLLTMGCTVAFSFGFVSFFYGCGWFGFSPHSATRYVDCYFWVIPVLAFSFVCVVSLDYDVFLMTRVIEFRVKAAKGEPIVGMDPLKNPMRCDIDCVLEAVGRSGHIISWAGFIMFVAFGSLMFANTVMMVQYGMTLGLAVLFDAFVVRPIVVPAIMALVPSKVIWFPRCMPRWEDANADSMS